MSWVRSTTFRSVSSSDVVGLSWTKVAVEDQGLSVELHRSDHDILELAATERVAWIDPVANLQNSIRNLDPCRARQLI